MKRILAVITARGGSKGIPGKNIKNLAGKPLITWTIQEAKKSTLITDLIVSTDDENIATVCREEGVEVPFIRPINLAEDSTPHLPVMQHAVKEMEKLRGYVYDYVVILQPTSPFRKGEYIDETVRLLISEGTDSAVSVYEIDGSIHPMRIKQLDGNRVLSYCMEEIEGARRQDLPQAFKRSGDVYAMTRKCLMELNMLYGHSVAGYVVPKERVIDIDEPDDWLVAEQKATRFNRET